MIPITTQSELDKLLSSIDWADAFVKEVHLFSPTYVRDHGIVAHDAYPSANIIICAPEMNELEFLFTEIENLNLAFAADLSPRGRLFKTFWNSKSYWEFSFHGDKRVMRVQQLAYRFLEGTSCTKQPWHRDEDEF
jgi:hypothetical protein